MSFDPEIVVLYCQHCVAEPGRVNPAAAEGPGPAVRSTMIPCSSKVEISHLLTILEQGADGVEVVACPEDQCRFLVGSRMAQKRIDRARRLLDAIRMGAERVGFSRAEGLSAGDLLGLARARAEAVRPLGPNPMKEEMIRDRCGVEAHR